MSEFPIKFKQLFDLIVDSFEKNDALNDYIAHTFLNDEEEEASLMVIKNINPSEPPYHERAKGNVMLQIDRDFVTGAGTKDEFLEYGLIIIVDINTKEQEDDGSLGRRHSEELAELLRQVLRDLRSSTLFDEIRVFNVSFEQIKVFPQLTMEIEVVLQKNKYL